MSTERERAQRTIDSVFGPRGSAVDALYIAPAGGAAVPCRVIRDNSDREVSFGVNRPIAKGDTLEVRRSEIAAPEKGGQFQLLLDDGLPGDLVKVSSAPKCEDPDRLVWTMTVG